MDSSSTNELQQLSQYDLDCLVDLMRIAISLIHIGTVLAPLVATVLAVFWWKKVKGKNRNIGMAMIVAATIFIYFGGSTATGVMTARLALLREAGLAMDSPPKAVRHH